jgi:WD40 repeat protein
MELSPETLVQARYRIVRLIGQGKMGAVYEAFDEHLAQTIALKQTLTSGEQFSKAFEREAKMLAGLRHPVLPIVIDHFTNDNGQFMVMDFIPGKDLAEMVRQQQKPFDVQAVMTWADQILHALEYLHRQQPPIIHRDIKPQNLKLTAEGQVILLDFGLAKGKTLLEPRDYQLPRARKVLSQVAEGDTDPNTLDGVNDIFGFTRQYAPLEQVQGTGTDPRSDIYALAATLYHLLTGAPPVEALQRLQAQGYDNYSHYEAGLDKLQARMQAEGHAYDVALPYEKQLRENIELARLYGDNPTSQNERSDLFDALDEIARASLGIGFNRLCRLDFPPPDKDEPSADPLQPVTMYHPDVPEAINDVIQQALALNPEHRPASAAAMRTQLQAAQRSAQQPTQDENDSYFQEPFLPPHPNPPAPTAEQSPRRRSEKILVGIIVAILLTQIVLVAINHTNREASASKTPPAALAGTTISQPGQAIAATNAATIVQLARWDEHTGDVQSVAFSPDGTLLASSSADNTIQLRLAHNGLPLRTLEGHTDMIKSVAFAPDGSKIASGSADNTVKLWAVESGTLLRTLPEHPDNVEQVAFAPDGKTLASASADGAARLWQTDDGALRATLEAAGGELRSIAFSPDGHYLAAGSTDNTVRLWRLSDGKLLHILPQHSDNIESVAFSPDGRYLAAGSQDKQISLWQVNDGSIVQQLTGHNGAVNSVAFHPDKPLLASAAADDTIRLWQLETGTMLCELQGHTAEVQSIAFAPDGRLLASGGEDNTVRLWGVVEDIQQTRDHDWGRKNR